MPPLCAGDQVIEVNVSTDPKKTRDITGEESQVVDFTYSAKWEETQIPFDRRMQKYSKYSFLPQHLEVRARTACATLCSSAHLLFWQTPLVAVGRRCRVCVTCCAVGALQIHWFSIINSCVTVLLLTGFLATILMRVLKNDFLKYSRDEEAGACCCCCPCTMHMLLFIIPKHSHVITLTSQ